MFIKIFRYFFRRILIFCYFSRRSNARVAAAVSGPEQCSPHSLPNPMHKLPQHGLVGRSCVFRSVLVLRQGGSLWHERRSEATELACLWSFSIASSFGLARAFFRGVPGVEVKEAGGGLRNSEPPTSFEKLLFTQSKCGQLTQKNAKEHRRIHARLLKPNI